MSHNDKKRAKGDGASLSRAKRRFLLNFCAFSCVALAAVFIFSDSEKEERSEIHPPAETSLNLSEKAYLNGQVLGLSEHPVTIPEYEAAWAMKVSRTEVERDTATLDLDESELNLLTKAFFKGYTERFHDYYDSTPARELGHKWGVKFNPVLKGYTSPPDVSRQLAANKEKLKSLYPIPDEATWQLFCKAFQAGFNAGYFTVEEGVTEQSFDERVELFREPE